MTERGRLVLDLLAALDDEDIAAVRELLGVPTDALLAPAADRGEDVLLTVPEAAQRAACHPETIRRAVRRGDLAALKVGRELRVRVRDLDAWLSRTEPERHPQRSPRRHPPRSDRRPMADALARL